MYEILTFVHRKKNVLMIILLKHTTYIQHKIHLWVYYKTSTNMTQPMQHSEWYKHTGLSEAVSLFFLFSTHLSQCWMYSCTRLRGILQYKSNNFLWVFLSPPWPVSECTVWMIFISSSLLAMYFFTTLSTPPNLTKL